jgi:hypothetical protein
MRLLPALSTMFGLTLIMPALAGNTSSNSSSNSSNGVHTRVDTIITDNGRGRTVHEHRFVRERVPYGHRPKRHWRSAADEDD